MRKSAVFSLACASRAPRLSSGSGCELRAERALNAELRARLDAASKPHRCRVIQQPPHELPSNAGITPTAPRSHPWSRLRTRDTRATSTQEEDWMLPSAAICAIPKYREAWREQQRS